MENISAQEQRKRFRRFSKSHFTYTGSIPLALPVLLSFILVVCCCIPIKEPIKFTHLFPIIYLALFLPYALLFPYVHTVYENQPQKKQQKICHVLQYLPISGKQIRRELAEYLWRFIWKVSLTALLGHTIFSCIAGCFRIYHMLFILLMTLVIPICTGLLLLMQYTDGWKSSGN